MNDYNSQSEIAAKYWWQISCIYRKSPAPTTGAAVVFHQARTGTYGKSVKQELGWSQWRSQPKIF